MKWLLKFSFLTLIHISAFGQTPEKMSYQAVIRDHSGDLLENSNVDLKIVLRQGTPNGVTVYEETHKAKTNKNGLLSLEIGTGTIVKGPFKDVNWSLGPFFIETHLDPKGTSKYKLNGISEILSVPYALHAKSADSFTGNISPSQLPDFYTAAEIDYIFSNMNMERTNNSNFSGDYRDLLNKPVFFSGIYSDLQDKPELYDKAEIDKLIEGIKIQGASSFSGIYDDLQNKPEIYNRAEIDKLIEGIEITGGSTFSGVYDDLENKPEIYNRTEIDKLIEGIGITGGSSFSGVYDDLQNKPELFTGEFADLKNKPELYDKAEIEKLIEGIQITGGSTFSGIYDDLQNKPEIYNRAEIDKLIEGIEITGGSSFSGVYDDLQNKPELFTGEFADLKNKPELYDKAEIDKLIEGIEITGGSTFSGVYDDLQNKPELYNKAEIDKLIEGIEITGGSSFSGLYDDLQNKPELFTGEFADLKNKPVLFSGRFEDLQDKPELYNKSEIEKLIEGIEIPGGSSFSGVYDDLQNKPELFTGEFADLKNKPVLFSGQYTDLQNKPEVYNKVEIDNFIKGLETTGNSLQNLTLEGRTLTISGGNTVSFENWDMNAADDFDGEYTSLKGAPKVYTQEEVNAIKAELLATVKENYSPKARVVSLSSSRNVNNNDVGNTIACTSSATLTISTEFSGMQVGDIINLEVHGTILTIRGATGVVINGKSALIVNIGNNEAYRGGLIRKIANNSYIVL